MPAASAARASVNVSSASSLRPARCSSPASWLMASDSLVAGEQLDGAPSEGE